jgi:DNA replication protein DnaC
MEIEAIEINDKIRKYSKELRLPAFRNEFEIEAIEAAKANSSFEKYLFQLMEKEYYNRIENRKKSQIRQAGFPQKHYLHELEKELLPEQIQQLLPSLEKLDFIKKGQNIVLAGNPGTGKTHVATGLGIKACQQNYKVLFITVPRLITQLRESHSERTLRQMENRFEKYDLVICDEFGYVSFDKQGAEMLFTHLCLRAGRKSTIITTNLSFDRWGELFADPVLTAAMVDRLTHKAHIINMNGGSFRLKETKEMIENQTGK